ncbi:MAG: O-antigen ligase family protein [Candidatus Schekmanbacteria bacterium]|nr:O-antigen ligase family protein [Candidatus Schekmanbacteria bacterium]
MALTLARAAGFALMAVGGGGLAGALVTGAAGRFGGLGPPAEALGWWALAALATPALVLLVLLAMRPSVALPVLVFLLPLVPERAHVDLGVAITVDRVLALILGAGLLAAAIRRPHLRFDRATLAMMALFGLYCGWLVALLPATAHPLEALFHPLYRTALWAILFGAGWYTSTGDASSRTARQMAVGLCMACAILVGLGGLEVAADQYWLSWPDEHRRDGVLRAMVFLGNPLVFGVTVSAASLASAGLAVSARRRCERRWTGWAALALGTATAVLLASGSTFAQARSSALGFLVAGAVFATGVWWWPARSSAARESPHSAAARAGAGLAAIALTLVAVTAVAAFVTVPEQLFDRWAAANVSHRISMFWISGRLLAEHPIGGVGLSAFADAARAVPTFRAPFSPFQGAFLTADNAVLQIAVEAGLPAAGLLMLLVTAPLWRIISALRQRGETEGAAEWADRGLLAGLSGLLVTLFVASQMFDLYGWLVPGALYFAFSGAAWAIAGRLRQGPEAGRPS